MTVIVVCIYFIHKLLQVTDALQHSIKLCLIFKTHNAAPVTFIDSVVLYSELSLDS